MGIHVVVGATGGTGRALVAELAARGHRVRAVSRRPGGAYPDGVEVVAADAADPAAMREVCRGARAVHHCVNPAFATWTRAFPMVTRALLDAAGAADATLVFADDTWMYGRVDAPMTERTPVAPVSARGVLRAWLAELVLHAHARGATRVAIARAGELYGPGVESVLGASLVGAARAGRRVLCIGDPDLPLTPTFTGDFARVLADLGESDEADVLGRVWHVPSPAPTTQRELVDEICRQAGTRPRLTALGSRAARVLGLVSPLARDGAELVYQFEMPFVVDGSAWAVRTGFVATPYAEGVAHTLGDTPAARRRLLPV